jgi:hypothetical protein
MSANLSKATRTRNPMKLRLSLILTVLMFLAGCVSTDATLFNPARAPLPPIEPSMVQVFTSWPEVPEPYERIALISTVGDAGLTKVSDTIEAARKKAATLGANAIVLGSIREPNSGEALAAKTISWAFSGNRRSMVTAIRLLPSPVANKKEAYEYRRVTQAAPKPEAPGASAPSGGTAHL